MSKQKKMGDRWEREVSKKLGGKKQPNSGAFGTQHKDASLMGDVVVRLPWLNREIHIECKAGYGGSTQMTVKRAWITKVREEAKLARRYPALALKFRDVRGKDRESAKVICFDFETWAQMMQEIEYLYHEYLSMLKARYDEENE